MPAVRIDQLDDPRLDPYRDLKRTNATRWSNQFVAEGAKLVRRLLGSGLEINSLLLGERYVDEFMPLVPAAVPVLVVPDRLIEQLVGFNFHRGVLACGQRPPATDLSPILDRLPARAVLLVCPEIHDPENLGTLLRISAAFGIDGVLLGTHCADPYSRRALRVSMGAVFHVPVVVCADLEADAGRLTTDFQFELIATVTDRDAASLDGVEPPTRTGIVLGSEGHGLDRQWIGRCHRQVTIPIELGTDSLNVAIAAGICLYHFTKRGPGHHLFSVA